jgi:heme/copper-type cytochrome/quinol oxidase subunit 2
MQPQARIWQMFLLISAVIVLVFAVVAFSTRSPREVSSERAYGLRRVLFLATLVAAIGVLAATFPKTPYAAHSGAATAGVDRIVYVAARQFEFIWSDEPIASVEDVGRVPRLDQVMVDAGATVEFRVTSLDVNHGFAVRAAAPDRGADPAMPGYINRLRVRLTRRASIRCSARILRCGHHRMRSSLIVR